MTGDEQRLAYLRPVPPVDDERAEDVFEIPLGAIVKEGVTGQQWVFVGWRRNTAGLYPNFVEAMTPDKRPGVPIYDYHATIASTLERKFPDITRFRTKPAQDDMTT